MSKMRRLWSWLEPGLIYMDPMISFACLSLTREIEMEAAEPAEASGSNRVSAETRGETADRFARFGPAPARQP
jgi:hypothetical protein